MGQIALTVIGSSLALTSPYDQAFVAALHATVPKEKKTWDRPRKVWLIDPAYGQQVADLCRTFYGVRLAVPRVHNNAQVETRAIKLEYLSRCRTRDGSLNGPAAAYGWSDGAWSVIMPEPILRAWFHASAAPEATQDSPSATKPRAPATLYAVLGIAPDVDASVLKKAWRRMVMQWHPDHCREPNAREMFEQVQQAYERLSDPIRRRRYDAGLKLQTTITQPQPRHTAGPRVDLQDMLDAYDPYGYRAPLRCGLVIAEGISQLGRFVVSKIMSWDDITDAQGRTMVSSWSEDADTFVIDWYKAP